MIVEKAVNMANMMNVPVLGLIENMSYIECPDCGKEIKVFGDSHIEEISEKFNIPVLDKIQFISNICKFVVTNLLTYTICFLYICIQYFYFSLHFFHQKRSGKPLLYVVSSYKMISMTPSK